MKGGNEYKKGLLTAEEDRVLTDYITVHGKGNSSVNLGEFSKEEDDLIIRLHKLPGNRWALIAGRLLGRTDNQVTWARSSGSRRERAKKQGQIQNQSLES
ncbi:hypothetical protein TIFTF001_048730 [Ficus carica]|uniref:Uncharacterized protein n=1 Tax=Ficus carica TaxID=3494 RepID=A0AA87Z965_FICCA|nr:hypothetical protein TIFTF001_048730 [Ficus carica]